MNAARTILSLLVITVTVVAGATTRAEDWGDILCNDCSQKVRIRESLLDAKLQPSLVWDRTYLIGGLEPEFVCEEGTVHEQSFLPAPSYSVSNAAYCDFSPWPDPYNLGLNPYSGLCGMVDEAQIALALTYAGVWNHVRIEAEQTVSIPVDYQTMSAVLLGNADTVDWEFDCSVWYNPQLRYTVQSGTIHGHVNTTSYWHIDMPRFPTLCQDRRFVVRAPLDVTARVYSILVHRRVCEPNPGAPEAFPQ
jgi:hypothetical protein